MCTLNSTLFYSAGKCQSLCSLQDSWGECAEKSIHKSYMFSLSVVVTLWCYFFKDLLFYNMHLIQFKLFAYSCSAPHTAHISRGLSQHITYRIIEELHNRFFSNNGNTTLQVRIMESCCCGNWVFTRADMLIHANMFTCAYMFTRVVSTFVVCSLSYLWKVHVNFVSR